MPRGIYMRTARLSAPQIKEIAFTLNRTETAVTLARKFGVNENLIMSAAAGLRTRGVFIPRSSSISRFTEVANDLRKSNPELFVKPV